MPACLTLLRFFYIPQGKKSEIKTYKNYPLSTKLLCISRKVFWNFCATRYLQCYQKPLRSYKSSLLQGMVRVIKYFNLPSFPSMPLSVTRLSTYLLIISHHLALWPWKGQLKSLDLRFSPGKEEGRHDWSLGSISPPNSMPWFCSDLTTWWPLQNKWERRKRLQQCQLSLFSLQLH